jgi:hypothetical protein
MVESQEGERVRGSCVCGNWLEKVSRLINVCLGSFSSVVVGCVCETGAPTIGRG